MLNHIIFVLLVFSYGNALGAPSCPPLMGLGSQVTNLPQTTSDNGVLETTLVARNQGSGPLNGSYDYQFCLLENDRLDRSSPVLRVKPGDRL